MFDGYIYNIYHHFPGLFSWIVGNMCWAAWAKLSGGDQQKYSKKKWKSLHRSSKNTWRIIPLSIYLINSASVLVISCDIWDDPPNFLKILFVYMCKNQDVVKKMPLNLVPLVINRELSNLDLTYKVKPPSYVFGFINPSTSSIYHNAKVMIALKCLETTHQHNKCISTRSTPMKNHGIFLGEIVILPMVFDNFPWTDTGVPCPRAAWARARNGRRPAGRWPGCAGCGGQAGAEKMGLHIVWRSHLEDHPTDQNWLVIGAIGLVHPLINRITPT